MNSNYSVLSYISQNTLILPCHCMHHIVAYCHVMIVFCGVFHGRFCLRGYFRVSNWRAVPYYYSIMQAAPLIISIQSHVLAPTLFYCIKTTRFKLLCATVVEPISSAWPVIATVTRWNPLACVGVVWAICMCCSYLAMPAMLRVVSGLVHLGDGLEWNDYVGNVRDVLNMIW